LNVVGRTFELLAFCTVTEIWLQTAIDALPRSMDSSVASSHAFWLRWLPSVFVVFTALLVVVSVCLSVVIFCRFPHAPNRDAVRALPISRLQAVLEALCWGVQCAMVMLSVRMTSRCILVLVPPTQRKRRVSLFGKAVGPMLVSVLAYATRTIGLVLADRDLDRRDRWAWWIGFVWGPTLAVSVVLLYSTRKRDSSVSDGGGGGVAHLDPDDDDDDDESVGGDDDDDDDASSTLQQSLLRPQPPEGK